MLQKAFLHVSPSLTATIILLNFTKLMFETSLLPSVFFGLERGGGGGEGGQHFLIWPKRVCTAKQGVVSRILSLKKGNTTSPFSIYVI